MGIQTTEERNYKLTHTPILGDCEGYLLRADYQFKRNNSRTHTAK